MFNFFFIFFCGNYRVMLMSFLLVLFFAVDQALRDQFIFVGDLAGCLSCSFLQVCKHWIWHKIPSHHSLQNWQHLFPWLQWAVYSGWPHAVFSQSSGHSSLLYLVWSVYGFEILCITSNALMVFSFVHSNCAPCKLQNTKSESTSEYIQRGIPGCLAEL